MIRALSLLLACLIAGCESNSGPPLAVTDVSVRLTSPGAGMAAGYLVFHNNGSAALSIVSITSPQFLVVDMHRTVIEDGVARMRPLPSVDIAPGESVRFEPGGRHLMLSRPNEPTEVGMPVSLEIRDSAGGLLNVSTALTSITDID